MKILVTGTAGFIGFHLAKKLLDRGDTVVGIDNINDYYDVNLKQARLEELGIFGAEASASQTKITSKTYKNHSFYKLDLSDKEAMETLFKIEKFDAVMNLAAQAGVRDYIHVVDLAKAHVKAIEYINSETFKIQHSKFNIGTGFGCSVLDMIKSFEKASGKKVPYEIVLRRNGDIAVCYANSTLAKEVLGWSSTKTLEQMCEDSARWQSNNPGGYQN